MKKLSMILAAITLVFTSIFAQVDVSNEVPEAVVTAFEAKYVDASDVLWEQEDGNWEADFVLADQEYEATFGIDGTWMKTSQEVSVEEVPSTITTALEADMPGFEVDEVEIVETPSGKFYEMELLVGGKTMNIVTNLDGKIVKKDAGQDDN